MSAVELLREAAREMRQAARNARAGRYVSTWQLEFPPAAVLAVADLLDATADEDGSGFALDCCGEGDACFACATAKSAVAVARAYLNRGQS